MVKITEIICFPHSDYPKLLAHIYFTQYFSFFCKPCLRSLLLLVGNVFFEFSVPVDFNYSPDLIHYSVADVHVHLIAIYMHPEWGWKMRWNIHWFTCQCWEWFPFELLFSEEAAACLNLNQLQFSDPFVSVCLLTFWPFWRHERKTGRDSEKERDHFIVVV